MKVSPDRWINVDEFESKTSDFKNGLCKIEQQLIIL